MLSDAETRRAYDARLRDTRNALGIGLSAALNTPIKDPSYGIFRM